ncbi:MAG TPA: carboxypeptidase-like regulatory domain-containing protein [Polyangiaceae bacterium]|nr:carboxypeptidase-like regulatory domain-containing protein [Polyangiaceae bacterium]
MIRSKLCIALAFVFPLFAGCGDDDEEQASCSLTGESGCKEGQVCEEVQGGEPACFAPISIKGKVFDALDESPIAGAHVIARDANDVAVSPVAISDAKGLYTLRVPVRRNADGSIALSDTDVTLRADALGYLTFPKAPRTALPFDIASGAGNPPVVQNAATDIALIPLEDASGLGNVSGKVMSDNPGGTLVVAGGSTGLADRDGDYTVFNVPAGSVEVSGYAPGVNLETNTAEVTANETTSGVNLGVLSEATASVTGNIQIVNAPGGSTTSVILVVEETFQENVARGEAPPGLRAFPVSGDFSIPNVPDGRYVVLAAFENDELVRDPDTSIGGTEIVHITVSGSSMEAGEGFKVTEALAVVSPGATEMETVSGTPTFVWADDSSEDSYTVVVYDALGNLIWEQEGIVGPGGNADAEVEYGGAALEPGMIYQFRATSIKDGVPISQTEDLRGVFLYE